MKTRTMDWSGKALMISGILIAASMVFHPDDTAAGSFLRPAWIPVHLLLGISVIIGLAGLGGLYTVISPKLSAFGRTSFGVVLLANVLMTGVMLFFEAALLPALSRDPAYEPLLNGAGSIMNGLFGYLIWFTMVIGAAGYIMLAVYLVLSRIISPINGILFLGVVLVSFAPPIPYVLEVTGGVLFGIALLWLGVSVRTGTAHKALEETVRMEDECMAAAGRA
jgi:hypothetical protein